MITDLTFPYLLKEPKTANPKKQFLLLLHGFGSNEQDLFSFADSLPPHIYVASARAPIHLFPGGFAWYNIDFTRGVKFTDSAQANDSLKGISQFIEELKGKYQVETENFYLGGFSQGAIMSYGIATNHPTQINGVIAMSGYVLKDILPDKVDREQVKKLKIFTTHGLVDEVIPVKMGQMGRDYMQGLGADIQYKEYPIGHGVSPEALHNIVRWFRGVLEG